MDKLAEILKTISSVKISGAEAEIQWKGRGALTLSQPFDVLNIGRVIIALDEAQRLRGPRASEFLNAIALRNLRWHTWLNFFRNEFVRGVKDLDKIAEIAINLALEELENLLREERRYATVLRGIAKGAKSWSKILWKKRGQTVYRATKG